MLKALVQFYTDIQLLSIDMELLYTLLLISSGWQASKTV